MPKYMVVMKGEGGTFAMFFDTISKAEEYRMDGVCGMGFDAEVYERMTDKDGAEYYEFMYA